MARHDIRLFRLAGMLGKQGCRKIISLDVGGTSRMTRNMISMHSKRQRKDMNSRPQKRSAPTSGSFPFQRHFFRSKTCGVFFLFISCYFCLVFIGAYWSQLVDCGIVKRAGTTDNIGRGCVFVVQDFLFLAPYHDVSSLSTLF